MNGAAMIPKYTVLDWTATKDWLSGTLHLSHDMLHVHVGMAIFVLASLVLRRPIGLLPPLLLLLGLETLNELSDFMRYRIGGWPWTPWPTVADYIDTLLWPAVLTLLFRADRLRRAAPPPAPPDEGR